MKVRNRAIRWHDPNPTWRARLRKLYPIEQVAACHRGDFITAREIEGRALRIKEFHLGLGAR